MSVLQSPSACTSDCAPCGEDCCCPEIGFKICPVRRNCGSISEGPENCKQVDIQVQWQAPPPCLLGRANGQEISYRVYPEGEVNLEDDPYLEVSNPEKAMCSDMLILDRMKWAESPTSCDQCSPKKLQLVAIADGVIIGRCLACAEELCDEECDTCSLTYQCWYLEKEVSKCGWGFLQTAAPGDYPHRYATAVVLFHGHKTIEYDSGGVGCEDYEAEIGTDVDNPLKKTYTSTRMLIIPGGSPCSSECLLDDEGGKTNDNSFHTDFEGPLENCGTINPILDPNTFGYLPAEGDFINAADDEPFDVLTYDEESNKTDWDVDENDYPTHRSWTWNDVQVHNNEEGLVLPYHQCFDAEDNDVDWTTSVNNRFDVQLSDEITTAEIKNEASSGIVSDSNYTGFSMDNSCSACYLLQANQLKVYYRSFLLRITNPSLTLTVRVTWNVVTYLNAEDAENPCLIYEGISPDVDPGTIDLTPGTHHDITIYPDIMGPNVVIKVENIGCEVLP